jgi:hypothetical protein
MFAGRLPTFCIFRWHQFGFGTEHLKNDNRKCRYTGKRMRPDTTRRKPLFRRTYQRENAVTVPQPFHFLHPAASAFIRVFSCWWAEEGAQSATWKRNKLVFLRNPASSRGMAEARPEHQLKSTRCKTLISGRLSAKAKNARSLLKPRLSLKSRCSNEEFCSRADTSAMIPSSPISQPERERRVRFGNTLFPTL